MPGKSNHGIKGFEEHDNGYRGIPYHHINEDLFEHTKILVGLSSIDRDLAAYYHSKHEGRKYNDVYYHFSGGF